MTSLAKSLSQLALRWRFTAYDQYASIYKAPANSKIVLYGAHNQLFTNLINKYFNHQFHSLLYKIKGNSKISLLLTPSKLPKNTAKPSTYFSQFTAFHSTRNFLRILLMLLLIILSESTKSSMTEPLLETTPKLLIKPQGSYIIFPKKRVIKIIDLINSLMVLTLLLIFKSLKPLSQISLANILNAKTADIFTILP